MKRLFRNMGQVNRAFPYNEFSSIPLSPVIERTEVDLDSSELSNHPSVSIFDPPEGNDELQASARQCEPSLDDDEQPLHLTFSEDSQNSKHLSTGRITRSKTGTVPKRQSLLLEEVVGPGTDAPKKKRTRKSTKKVSLGTQVVPSMLPPTRTRKRAPKKKGTENEEMKENMPPNDPNDQPKPGRKRVYKKKGNNEQEVIRNEMIESPKTLDSFREVHSTSGITMPRQSSSPNTSTQGDFTIPSELSMHGIGSSPQSSSPLPTSVMNELDNPEPCVSRMSGIGTSPQSSSPLLTSVMNDVDNPEPSGSRMSGSSRYPSSGLYHTDQSSMCGISSLSEEENEKKRSLTVNKEGISNPLSGLTIQIPSGSGTFGIKVSNGQIIVSSKSNPAPKVTTNKKREKTKRDKKSRGGRRSRKDRRRECSSCEESSTSSDSDDSCSCSTSSTDESSCSCSACNSSDSSSSSSSLLCDHHHHHHCHHR